MLTHPTIDLLRSLKLDGMTEAFLELQSQDRAKDLDHGEWLALLLDREAANRGTRRFQSRLRSARLRHGHPDRLHDDAFLLTKEEQMPLQEASISALTARRTGACEARSSAMG